MLEKILDYIHNYFVQEIHTGSFKIESGALQVDFLKNGQYFKITGSSLNEGVFLHPSEDLVDENFTGQIWALSVPRSLIKLSDEITDWVDKYGETANSPFQSESFGGYSYTKSNNNGDDSSKSAWQLKFGSQLNAYRKIS